MIINYGCAKLRAIEKEDFDLLFYLINAPEIEKMTGGWCFPISHMAQGQWMETFRNSDKNIKLMIELSNHKTIGMIMLTDIDWKNRNALLEYKMSAPIEDRIKGDMLDAVTGMLKYAFEELGLHCITSLILEENKFSLKLCKRAGFVQEGILRDRIYKEGTYKNQIVLSLLKDEFCEREK
ncbi:GNAT family protein [Lachnospiraceae bacterium 50-23]